MLTGTKHEPLTPQPNIAFPENDDTVKDLGKKVYYASCNACHKDSGLALAPSLTILSAMTPRAILAALDNGKMRQQAVALSEKERMAVAEWLTGSPLNTAGFSTTSYTAFILPKHIASKYNHSGWGNNLEGTGFRTTAQAGIDASNVASLKLKWVFAFPDATAMRCKPAVIGDWLITGGQFGELIAIRRQTGKIGWIFHAGAAIRGAVTVRNEGGMPIAFFADFTTNTYAVDIRTGKMIWSQRAGFDQLSSVTGSVALYNGKVYVPISSLEVASAANGKYPCCMSSGGVVALDARTGKEIWKHRVIREQAKEAGKKKNGSPFYGPSGGPVWCSPTIDSARGLLYIGTGENYSLPTTVTSDAVQALDLKTGRLVWNFQATSRDAYNLACPSFNNCPWKTGPDLDFGMAPIIVKRKNGKDLLLAGQKAGVVYALSPANGKLIWKTRIGKGGALGGIHWGMATDGKYVYAANADNILGIDKSDSTLQPTPGLYALDISTGKIIWKVASPSCEGKQGCYEANSAAPLVIPGIVFAGALDGHIRAYSTTDGKILWDFNTMQQYDHSSTGITGKGGAIDGPPPVVCDGMLFVNSGYGMFGEMPGNVLLAFEVERR